VEYRKILKESTSNEAWNISNTKLQVLADATYNWYVFLSFLNLMVVFYYLGMTTKLS